eukprot:CAMPEP_0197465758 /NCGR_PEP_ID=MMETSP1175-20131217/64696_1 /TAXON_ID=1003142 /ORGANISM="Triceratium dubium, Strain CCMP147" /LENGTH=569 /DNA_ID=CAMNT_0043001779 /DNA_START=1846 /DNA_END=3555 /DNA_ORIENTATION=-
MSGGTNFRFSCITTLVVVAFAVLDVIAIFQGLKSQYGATNRALIIGVTPKDESDELGPLFPLTTWDYLGFTACVLGLLVAAGGGIGGGGILVPIYILLLRFPVKHAIPLANATVFGGGVANTILNVRKRHPYADRPLIDWNLILMMEPLTMGGALVGATLTNLLPDIVIVVMLVVLLTFTAKKTLHKAKKMHNQESLELVGWSDGEDLLPSEVSTHEWSDAESGDSEDPQETEEGGRTFKPLMFHMRSMSEGHRPLFRSDSYTAVPLLLQDQRRNSLPPRPPHRRHDSSLPTSIYGSVVDTQNKSEGKEHDRRGQEEIGIEASKDSPTNLLEQILEEERHAPLYSIIMVSALFVSLIVINVLKGGGHFPSPLGIECGSSSWWAAKAVTLLCVLGVCVIARYHLMNRTKLKEEANYEYLEGDIIWDGKATVVYPAICSVAGFAAGMFGIGGGIVKGPLMLSMGVHPSVASATSACMILFTSFTATTSFMVFGLLRYDYAVACVSIGFFATLLGQTLMAILMKRHGRSSYIAFSIGIVVAISAVCMTAEMIMRIVEGGSQEVKGFCAASSE